MGSIVICGYLPKADQAAAFEQVLATHAKVLREQGLVTKRPFVAMKNEAGQYLEVFEWTSSAAIEAAHSNSAVQDLWGAFAAVCTYIPPAEVATLGELFAEFTPVDLPD